MPQLLVFCDNCEAIFNSGICIENSSNVSFSNCKSGPCPNCGGMGHIPDGIYNIIGKTIELLTGPNRTINELTKLADLIKRAKEDHLSSEAFLKDIDREVPELSDFKDVLPKTRAELYQFLIVILMLITIILSLPKNFLGKKDGLSKLEIEQLIKQGIEKSCVATQHRELPKKKKKVGRNDPCLCGSGKKYKKCHGKDN
jgi:hypothetical protein